MCKIDECVCSLYFSLSVLCIHYSHNGFKFWGHSKRVLALSLTYTCQAHSPAHLTSFIRFTPKSHEPIYLNRPLVRLTSGVFFFFTFSLWVEIFIVNSWTYYFCEGKSPWKFLISVLVVEVLFEWFGWDTRMNAKKWLVHFLL